MKITQHSKGKKDAFATFLIVSLLKKNMMELKSSIYNMLIVIRKIQRL